jgi:phosphoribosylformylglycinamidine cyclo-ligase
MVVDDLVVCGAEPLFLQDYIACGQVVPERIAEIVGGIAPAASSPAAPSSGGETAEHPGLMPADHYDIAGTGVGVVRRTSSSARHVREGDVVVAMASSGLHSNGFSPGAPRPARRAPGCGSTPSSTSSASRSASTC